MLGNKNKELPDEDWEKLIEEFDRNGDGMINFDEFKGMMLSLHNGKEGILEFSQHSGAAEKHSTDIKVVTGEQALKMM